MIFGREGIAAIVLWLFGATEESVRPGPLNGSLLELFGCAGRAQVLLVVVGEEVPGADLLRPEEQRLPIYIRFGRGFDLLDR